MMIHANAGPRLWAESDWGVDLWVGVANWCTEVKAVDSGGCKLPHLMLPHLCE